MSFGLSQLSVVACWVMKLDTASQIQVNISPEWPESKVTRIDSIILEKKTQC